MNNSRKNGIPNRYVFLLYNIVYGIWNTLIVPYTPAFMVGGVFPSQLLYYNIGLAITAIVWGTHMTIFLRNQPGE